jgi:hypothetical protein
MTKHYNQSIVENALRILNSKQDFLPQEVQGPIATIAIEPSVNFSLISTKTNTGSATLFTTPTDKSLYVSAVMFGFTKNATCDVASGTIGVDLRLDDGSSTGALRSVGASVLTLTAERDSVVYNFPIPIKLAPGSAISFSNAAFTVGALIRNMSLYGYTVETTR